MFAILALIIAAVIMFFIPVLAENSLIHLIVAVLITLVAIVSYRAYGRDYYKNRPKESRFVFMICFGLATGFMLSGLVVGLLGQPLPIHYSLPLFFAFIGVGAFIGDWIGKKRNYQFPSFHERMKDR